MSRIDEKRFIETSRGTLDYFTIDLINQISKQPVIWNRLHQDFKNSEAKNEAWHTIGRVFVPFYDDVDAEEQENITESLKNRWRNCVSGLMASAAMKRKNDRLFCPYKYAREMEFYLETRGMKLSDIYDEEENDDIEEVLVKLESKVDGDDEEIEDENEEDVEPEPIPEPAPKNKKNTTADTSITYRSARLREKQTVLEKNSPEKKSSTPNKTKQRQIKKITPVLKNDSVPHSLGKNSSSNEVVETVEDNKEDNHHSYNNTPQPKKPKTVPTAVNHSVNITQNSHQHITFTNESEAADQAFFDSIKPALRKMNESQKLDFQIDILQILKSFRTN